MAGTWTEHLPNKSSECYNNSNQLGQNQYWSVFLLTLLLYIVTLHFAVEYTNVNLIQQWIIVPSVKARSSISDSPYFIVLVAFFQYIEIRSNLKCEKYMQ